MSYTSESERKFYTAFGAMLDAWERLRAQSDQQLYLLYVVNGEEFRVMRGHDSAPASSGLRLVTGEQMPRGATVTRQTVYNWALPLCRRVPFFKLEKNSRVYHDGKRHE